MRDDWFKIKLEKHEYVNGHYFIEGRVLPKSSELMLTCGLRTDHSTTVTMKLSQIDKLIEHLQQVKLKAAQATVCTCGCTKHGTTP